MSEEETEVSGSYFCHGALTSPKIATSVGIADILAFLVIVLRLIHTGWHTPVDKSVGDVPIEIRILNFPVLFLDTY